MAILDNAVWLNGSTGFAENGSTVVSEGGNSTTVTGVFTANAWDATSNGTGVSDFGAAFVTAPIDASWSFSNPVEDLSFTLQHVSSSGTTYDDEFTIRIYDQDGVLIPSADVIAGITGNTNVTIYANPDGSVVVEADNTTPENIVFNITGYQVSAVDINFDVGPDGTQTGGAGVSDFTFTVPPEPDFIVEGTAGNDTIDATYVGDPEGDLVDNSDHSDGSNNDSILAGAGDDSVVAGAGDDTVYGSDGADTLIGGVGADYLDGDDAFANGAADSLSGGDGNDTLIGDVGNDTLEGGADNDVIYAGADDDSVSGGIGQDTLYGEAGDDSIDGGTGSDLITAGSGDDTIALSDGFGNDTIQGGETGETNGDTLDLSALTAGATVDLSNANPETGTVESSGDTASFSEIENIILGSGRDTVQLGDNGGADAVQAFDMTDSGDGTTNDQLDVSDLTSDGGTTPVTTADVVVSDTNGDGTGDAILSFPGGETITLVGVLASQVDSPAELESIGIPTSNDNIVSGTTGNDDIGLGYTDVDGTQVDAGDALGTHGETVGSAADSITAGAGDDTVNAGSGDDTVDGGTGDDVLYGNGGDDSITGGAGSDRFQGDTGNDTLDGGADADRFDQWRGEGNDTVIGGETGNDVDTLWTIDSTDGVDVTFTGDEAGVSTHSDGTGTTFTEIEQIYGSGLNDTIDGSASNATMTVLGNQGDDDITGGGAGDSLSGDDGNDTIDGGAGNDTISGGDNDDVVSGGLGDDSLHGNGGNDTLYGNAGTDTLVGASGDDLLYGGDGNDTVLGGTGRDYLSGGANNDSLNGGDDNDDLDGGDGDDTVIGGAGDDNMDGDAGNDSMSGGTGNDSMWGGAGDDTMVGGDGNDALYANSGNDSIDAGAGTDYIQLESGNDTVQAGDDADNIDIIAGSYADGAVVTVDGGTGGVDTDSLNLTTWSAFRNLTQTADTDADSTSGSVEVQDATGNWITVDFTEIETLNLPGTDLTPDFIVEGTAAGDLITGLYTGDPEGDMVDNNDHSDGSNDDLIYGYGGDDVVEAGQGDDTVYGGVGDDTLMGGDGNDSLEGGADNDDLYSGLGDDTVLGGDGNDSIFASTGADSIDAGAGDDTIRFTDSDTVEGGDGDDLFRADALVLDGSPISISGGEGGESSGDTLNSGTYFNDVTVDLNAGGTGADPESGTMQLGTTTVTFDEIENVQTGTGDDNIIGSTGDDNVATGAGQDTVDGGAGNDTADLGSDSDRDTVIFSDGDGQDTLINFDLTDSGDGTTVDQLNVSGLTSDGGTTPVTTTDVTVTDTNGDGTGDAILTFPGGESITLTGITPSQVDDPSELAAMGIPLGPDYIVEGTSGADLIDGAYVGDPEGDMIDSNDHSDGSNADSVQAGGGNDTVVSGAGNDSIQAGAGNDDVNGGAGEDLIIGADGDDLLAGADGNDTIIGGSEHIQGGSFEGVSPTTFGQAGNHPNWYSWNNGSPDLNEEGGFEASYASDSAPTDGSNFASLVYGSNGVTEGISQDLAVPLLAGTEYTLTLNAAGGWYQGSNDFDPAGGSVELQVWGNPTAGEVSGDFNSGPAGAVLLGSAAVTTTINSGGMEVVQITFTPTTDIATLSLSAFDADVTGFGAFATLAIDEVSLAEANTTDNDTITGGLGDDLIFAGLGADSVHGGADDDTISGDAGADVLHGDAGNDSLDGGADNDTLYGGDGADTMLGGAGNDSMEGWLGDDSMLGGDGDDYIDAAQGNDTLEGGDGNDTLLGGSDLGDDSLVGGAGNDSLSAGDGEDTLVGGTGDDSIFAGGGDDTIVLEDNFGNDTIHGWTGGETDGDTLDLSAVTSDLTVDLSANNPEDGSVTDGTSTATFQEIENIILGAGRDTVVLADGGGNDTVQAFDMADSGDGTTNDQLDVSGLTSDGGTTPVTTADVVVTDSNGDGTGDAILTFPGGQSIMLVGVLTSQVDSPAELQSIGIPAAALDYIVEGTDAGEVINAGYGGDPEGDQIDNNDHSDGSNDDSIQAGGGNDTIDAGLGDDTVDTGDGDDIVYGQSGDDSVLGAQGDDSLFGEAGADTLEGGIGADSLDGGDDNDSLDGGAGNDTLWGQDGNDTLSGGDNDDFVNGGLGDDLVLGGDGNDTLEGWFGNDTIEGGAGNDYIDADNDSDYVDAGDGDDTVVGGFSVSTDTIIGGAGNDSLNGQAGDDLIYGGTGNDVQLGADGDDTFYIEDTFGADTITGGETDETNGDVLDLSATTTGVTVDLSDANTETGTLSDGTDTASFSEIENIVLGGGRDTVVLSDGGGADAVQAFDMTDSGDGTTNDQLDVSGLTSDGGTTSVHTGDVTVTDTNGDGTGDAILTFPGGESITLVGVLASQVDTPAELQSIGIPAPGPDFIVEGTSGADAIGISYIGDPEGDRVDNNDHSDGSNDDSIEAGDGNDTVFAGLGNDTVDAGAGDDTVFGQSGDDTLIGGAGGDSLDGDSGSDSILGGSGSDTIIGDDGNDTLRGGDDDDEIYVSTGDNLISGDAGNDQIFAGDGNDTISGGANADTIVGGAGNDSIDGGTGDDRMSGGDGDDLFVYNADQSTDTITDFNAGNTGTLDDGDNTNNDYVDLSGFYDHISELYADQADDGVLNQSNVTDTRGLATDYSDNTSFGDGSLTLTGVSADSSGLTVENTGVVCFTSGTAIRTPQGDVLIDDLKVGDLVSTLDNGPQPIRWIGRRSLDGNALRAAPNLRPIHINRGVLGATRDLLVSRQHGMLVGQNHLVRAGHLAGAMRGVRVANGKQQVTYVHMLFDDHQIVFAENSPSESFFPGPMALQALSREARVELFALFPEAFDVSADQPIEAQYGTTAREFLTRQRFEWLHI